MGADSLRVWLAPSWPLLKALKALEVQHPDEQHRAGVVMELGLILGIFAGWHVRTTVSDSRWPAPLQPEVLAGSVLALLTQFGLHP